MAAASDGDREQLTSWLHRGRDGLARCFDTTSGLCVDYDVRTASNPAADVRGIRAALRPDRDAGHRAAARLLDAAVFWTAAVALDWSAAECGGDASLHLEARRAYL